MILVLPLHDRRTNMKTNRAFLAQIDGLRQERIVKMQRFFLRGIDAHLSADELLEIQYLIRDEYSIRLGIDALMGATENTGAYRHQIDMAQEMIDHLEGTSGQKSKGTKIIFGIIPASQDDDPFDDLEDMDDVQA
jgi:hypothetical protein